ncbi:MAG: hypothetical protein ACI4RV_00080 [Eubacteriales bacterium]
MDTDYNALFGVSSDDGATADTTGEGNDENNGVDSQAERADAGSNENREGAEPETDVEEKQGVGGDSSDSKNIDRDADQGTKREKGAKQSSSENARFAAARRKAEAERDAAVQEERRKAQEQLDTVIASLGLSDPFTGEAITTKEAYDAYKNKISGEQKQRLIKRSGMTEQQFNEFVSDLPEVREARRVKAEAEASKREADEARAKAKVDEQIREIGKLDSSVKSLEDLTKMENYEAFYDLVKKGNTLLDAYKIVTYEKRAERAASMAKQSAINAEVSKEHLTKTGTRGAGAVTVPAEVREQYKLFNPDATDAEIEAHYNRFHKI